MKKQGDDLLFISTPFLVEKEHLDTLLPFPTRRQLVQDNLAEIMSQLDRKMNLFYVALGQGSQKYSVSQLSEW